MSSEEILFFSLVLWFKICFRRFLQTFCRQQRFVRAGSFSQLRTLQVSECFCVAQQLILIRNSQKVSQHQQEERKKKKLRHSFQNLLEAKFRMTEIETTGTSGNGPMSDVRFLMAKEVAVCCFHALCIIRYSCDTGLGPRSSKVLSCKSLPATWNLELEPGTWDCVFYEPRTAKIMIFRMNHRGRHSGMSNGEEKTDENG